MTPRPGFVIVIVAVLALLAGAHPAAAQAKAADKKDETKATAGAAQPDAAAAATKKPDLPAPPPNFEYAPEGRRDPFVSLVNRGADTAPTTRKAQGVPGLITGELTVRGLLHRQGVWIAMASGSDGKVYTIRAGDRLADGVVREITGQYVVILQEVNDPLSLDKQREVRKFLRGGEGK